MTLWTWSRTAADNDDADSSINVRDGWSPRIVKTSVRAIMAAVAKYRDDNSGVITTGGTASAYTVTTYQVFGSLTAGLTVTFTPHVTNNDGATLNVDGLGAKALRTASGESIPVGALVALTPYRVTYYSNEWIVHGAQPIGNAVPIGSFMPYGGSTAPSDNFVLPYGQAISRTTYATLYGIFGTTFGTGNGTTTFNVPDLRGRAVFGLDNMGGSTIGRITNAGSSIVGTTIGASGGSEDKTISKTYLPDYALADTLDIAGSQSGGLVRNLSVDDNPLHANSGTAESVGDMSFSETTLSITGSVTLDGGGTPLPIMPPCIILPYILRVK